MAINVNDDKKAAGFLQEDNGNLSSMRLMCFMCVLAAIGFGLLNIWLVASGKADGGGVQLSLEFLLTGFGGKTVQKFAEKKPPD
jgi:hypothetical protein